MCSSRPLRNRTRGSPKGERKGKGNEGHISLRVEGTDFLIFMKYGSGVCTLAECGIYIGPVSVDFGMTQKRNVGVYRECCRT